MQAEVKLPRYRCHKEVNAAKIFTVIPNDGTGGAKITFYRSPTIDVDHHFMARCNPSAGGYFVVYEDGYTSFSPAKAFEEGYTLIEEEV